MKNMPIFIKKWQIENPYFSVRCTLLRWRLTGMLRGISEVAYVCLS